MSGEPPDTSRGIDSIRVAQQNVEQLSGNPVFSETTRQERLLNVRANASTSKRTMKANQAELNPTLSGVTDAILEVGRQRKALLSQMRSALQSRDTEKVLTLARQICGLIDEKCPRVN